MSLQTSNKNQQNSNRLKQFLAPMRRKARSDFLMSLNVAQLYPLLNLITYLITLLFFCDFD